MNGSIFVGKKVSDCQSYEPLAPVTGVVLKVDEETVYTAGDLTGNVWTHDEPYATQEMANAILEALKGHSYNGYDATNAPIAPDAELGDGVTVNGIYSGLDRIKTTFGPGHMSDISAPGKFEPDEEYKFVDQNVRNTNYRFARTYATIKKMNDEILLEIQNEAEELTSSFDVKLGNIQAELTDDINDLSADVTLKYNELMASLSSGLEGLSADFALKLTGLETSFQDDQEKQTAAFDVKLDGLSATFEDELSGVTSEFTTGLSGLSARIEGVEKKATEDLTAYAEAVTKSLGELQSQIDGSIMTWFYSYEPTTKNEPASSWTTEDDKIKHLGDVFYIVDNEEKGGQAYRWEYVDGDYRWSLIEDVEVAKALADAAKAQDTADHKRRVFTEQPKPPYDVGDLWSQGPTGELMRCNMRRESGSFIESDWGRASKYTDDSALTTFLNGDYKKDLENLRSQADQKAETWYQSADPSTAWTSPDLKSEHLGDMWYCTNPSDATHYQKSWRWNGSTWEEMKTTPPQAVFDQIDGKAQIFIAEPKTPYRKGDLWFNSETSDIMTCVKERLEGNYVSGDWQKRNKYTDDTYAEEKYAELNVTLEGITTEVGGLGGRVSTVEQTAEGLTTSVSGLDGRLTTVETTANGLSATVEGLDGKYTSLQQTVDGFTFKDESGKVWINNGNINLTGAITWEDLDSDVQGDINNRGISEERAKTLINDTLVAAPTIAGAKFYELDEKTGELGDTWLEIGKDGTGYGGMILKNTQYFGENYALFSVFNGDANSGYMGWKGKIFLRFDYGNDADGNLIARPFGTWDFSQSTVSGRGVDYVTEQGTQSNWTYRKWNSGVAECWRSETVQNVDVTNAWGSVYTSNAATFGSKAYPFKFSSAPSVQVSPENANGDWWVATYTAGSVSTSPGYQACRGTQSTKMSYTAHFHVVGRWK